MCRPQVRLNVDRASVQFGGFAIPARDHVEVRGSRVDLAKTRVVCKCALGPGALLDAPEQVYRRLERMDLERRQPALLDDLQGARELLVARIDFALLETHAGEQQTGADIVGIELENLVDPGARPVLETARRNPGQAEDGRYVIRREFEALLKEPYRLVVLVRFNEELAPAGTHRRILGPGFDSRLKETVRSARVAERAGRFGLDPDVVVAREQRPVAASGFGALPGVERLVAGSEFRGPVRTIFDPERLRRRCGDRQQQPEMACPELHRPIAPRPRRSAAERERAGRAAPAIASGSRRREVRRGAGATQRSGPPDHRVRR